MANIDSNLSTKEIVRGAFLRYEGESLVDYFTNNYPVSIRKEWEKYPELDALVFETDSGNEFRLQPDKDGEIEDELIVKTYEEAVESEWDEKIQGFFNGIDLERFLYEEGYDSFQHFIHTIKRKLFNGGINNASEKLNETLRSYNEDSQVRTAKYFFNKKRSES